MRGSTGSIRCTIPCRPCMPTCPARWTSLWYGAWDCSPCWGLPLRCARPAYSGVKPTSNIPPATARRWRWWRRHWRRWRSWPPLPTASTQGWRPLSTTPLIGTARAASPLPSTSTTGPATPRRPVWRAGPQFAERAAGPGKRPARRAAGAGKPLRHGGPPGGGPRRPVGCGLL